MTILQTTEMRHCNPVVLISLIRIGWSKASLSCKGEFGNTISIHLLRIGCKEGELLLTWFSNGWLLSYLYLWLFLFCLLDFFSFKFPRYMLIDWLCFLRNHIKIRFWSLLTLSTPGSFFFWFLCFIN